MHEKETGKIASSCKNRKSTENFRMCLLAQLCVFSYLTCLCHECTWTFWRLCLMFDLSCNVCLLRIWALETDSPLNLLPPAPVAWEIRSFCRRGTIDSLKLILLLLFSLFSLNEVLLRSAARPSKLLALAAISDLLIKSGRRLGLSFLDIESVSLEFSLKLG